MSVKPGLKLYYKVVSKPEYYSGNSKTGIYVTADDVEGWLHDMYLKGWEFISYFRAYEALHARWQIQNNTACTTMNFEPGIGAKVGATMRGSGNFVLR